MHKLLNIQLKKVYGKEFDINIQDEKFVKLIKLIENAYCNYEDEERFLEHTLDVNAKELEESNDHLYKKKELLKSVENSMEDAIFYKDLDHKYIGANTIFLEFIGISEENLIGKSDYDFFDTQTADSYREMNEDILKNRAKIIYKQWVDFKRRKVYVLTSKTALVDTKGVVIGIVGVSRDITHEYELQKEVEHKNIMLIQQNKLVSMGEMIANIAHQWRQPLNSLSLVIQKIGIFYKQDLLTDKKVDDSVSEAMLLMQGMSETIDDFRSFFSPERIFEDFSIEESILKSQAIIKSILKENNIQINLNMKNKYFVSGYKNEFFQVILNLLNNAEEALVIDKISIPIININVENDGSNIVIEVCDNANGIKNSMINKVFDPYFTTKDKGTGLGLYMSKIIIEEHMKGELSVESSCLGTTFTIKMGGGINLIYS